MVITAPLTHVLPGTVAKAVEITCLDSGIQFDYQFPKADFEDWVGCFITSLFLFIHM